MPKRKLRDTEGSSVSQQPRLNPAEVPDVASPLVDETSFKTLQEKIQAKLQSSKKKDDAAKRPVTSDTRANPAKFDARGKKRSSDGKVIEDKKPATITKTTNGTRKEDQSSEVDELRQVLAELGGTEEDLSLFADAGSESELDGEDEAQIKGFSKLNSESLEKGMSNILKEIALAQGVMNDTSSEGEASEAEETIEEKAVQAKETVKQSKKAGLRSQLKCEPRADWFNGLSTQPQEISEVNAKSKPDHSSVEELYAHAKDLLAAENDAFKATQQSSSSQAFYNTVIASGTLSDRISALTLAVQESPLHNVKALESLIGLASKRNRAQAIDVLRALKDLLAQGSLLPSDRRLYTFQTQPVLLHNLSRARKWKSGDKLPKGISESDLICWAYEDWLKAQYFEILQTLETWCNDEIDYSKQRAIGYIYELLKEKPEQEVNLLRLLINKLGDPTKKIASQTSYLLMQLLVSHPAMKMVVISAIEADFMFRPGQSMYGKYYAAVTLNQTALSAREEDVAKKLLDVCFGLFTGLLKSPIEKKTEQPNADEPQEVVSLNRRQQQRKKGRSMEIVNTQEEELREKLISAVLTGVNRAYPYAGADQKDFNQHLDTLFTITHSANFNTSIQAMLLIQQMTTANNAASDRFYRTLYESLLDPRLVVASKQQMYLNLLHRSLKSDLSIKRVKAFVKRLLQILSLHEPPFVCGVFFLLKDLEKTFPSLKALFDQSVSQDDGEEHFHDVDEDAPATVSPVKPESDKLQHYDAHKRAPEHANADNSNAWEVLPFLAHFHPSVAVGADGILDGLSLPGKPDLTLHTLIHFLDRFAYRNPKLSSNKMRGASIMQPMAHDDTHSVLLNSASRHVGPALNSDDFKSKSEKQVAVNDAFFHKYFATLGKDNKAKKSKKSRDVDGESIGDEGEDEVWKAMVDSAPDLEGEGSDDEDMDLSDFEAEMDDEDDLLAEMEEDDDDGSGVDIEAGIFDDSDEDMDEPADTMFDEEDQASSDFDGLSSADEKAAEKTKKNRNQREERKRKKSLPTFASAADYAKMIEDDEDEDLG